MEHGQFVRDYKQGLIKVRVNQIGADSLYINGYFKKEYAFPILFFSYLWLISIPVSIVIFIWVKWWIGLLVLFFGFIVPRGVRKSASDFVLDQALDDEQFYNIAMESRAMDIEPVNK